jgi:hypothetical protein
MMMVIDVMADRNETLGSLLLASSTVEETMVTETRETGNLIGSDKVEGTAVYGSGGNKIGSI